MNSKSIMGLVLLVLLVGSVLMVTNHFLRLRQEPKQHTEQQIAEVEKATVEETLQKLDADAMEYVRTGIPIPISNQAKILPYSEETRERDIYSRDTEAIMSDHQFRRTLENLQKIDKETAAEWLTKNIRDNLEELHKAHRNLLEGIEQGIFKPGVGVARSFGPVNSEDERFLDSPPTTHGRRCALLSYILLASHLGLQDVRPAVEEVVEFAEEEYRLYNRLNDEEVGTIRHVLLEESLYNPSLLLTATLCDPTWNTENRKHFEEKLADRVVDWQPHDTFKVRYYAGITDAEFKDFFGQ